MSPKGANQSFGVPQTCICKHLKELMVFGVQDRPRQLRKAQAGSREAAEEFQNLNKEMQHKQQERVGNLRPGPGQGPELAKRQGLGSCRSRPGPGRGQARARGHVRHQRWRNRRGHSQGQARSHARARARPEAVGQGAGSAWELARARPGLEPCQGQGQATEPAAKLCH